MLSWAGKEASGRSSSDRKGTSFSIFQPVESMRYQSISQSSAIRYAKEVCLVSTPYDHKCTSYSKRYMCSFISPKFWWAVKSHTQEHEEGVGKAVKMVTQTGLEFVTYIWKRKGTKERSKKERRKTRVIRTSL